MSIVFKIGDKYPESCHECPLFIDGLIGVSPFCVGDGEYTDEEINADEYGSTNMYYHGCLETRPKNCPLEQIEEVENE